MLTFATPFFYIGLGSGIRDEQILGSGSGIRDKTSRIRNTGTNRSRQCSESNEKN
jgi:hypothetical protein